MEAPQGAPQQETPPGGADAEVQDLLRRGLRYPLGARIFFWLDILLGAAVIKLALRAGLERSDPRVLLLAVPVIVTALCLVRIIPYTEHLGYLRIPYALVLTVALTWDWIRELHPPALVLVGFVGLWHAGYALAVRAYQKFKARLRAARELLAAAQAGGEEESLTPSRQERQDKA